MSAVHNCFALRSFARRSSIVISILIGIVTVLVTPNLIAVNFKPVRILEQKYFTKTMRPEFSLSLGTFPAETYIKTITYSASGGFYLNEFFGIEAGYTTVNSEDNSEKTALSKVRIRNFEFPNDPKKDKALIPDINYIHSSLDIVGIFVPFYGKIAAFSRLILYMDMYLTLGASYMNTDQGNKVGLTYGIGQHFFISKIMAVRFEFRNRNFNEQRGSFDAVLRNAFTFNFGFSAFI